MSDPARLLAHSLPHKNQINPHGAATITYRGAGYPTTTTTYGELMRTTNQVARALRRALARARSPSPLSLPPRIALLCRNHELALAYLFAIGSVSAIAGPLNPRWAAAEVAAVLKDCGR